MSRSTRRIATRVGLIAGSTAVLLAATAVNASASDASTAASYGGQVRAQATYDDLTDNLCVRVVNSTGNAYAEAAIAPYYSGTGLPTVHKFAYVGEGWRCTGNLSIAEDKKYELHLRWYKLDGTSAQAYAPVDVFFT